MTTRRGFAAIAVALLVATAGCNAAVTSGDSGPSASIEAASVVVQEDGPRVTFNYSVDTYATAMLKNPDGRVVATNELEPNKTTDSLPLEDPAGGNYTILIQSGNETVATKTMTFDGPDLQLRSVSPSWNANALESVTATVENTGDLPAKVTSARVVSNSQMAVNKTVWVGSGKTTDIAIDPAYPETLTASEPGEVGANVVLETSSGRLEDSFSKRVEPATPQIASISPTWDGETLKSVTVTIENTGDFPAFVHVNLQRDGAQLDGRFAEESPGGYPVIKPGESITYTISWFNSDAEPTAGGPITVVLDPMDAPPDEESFSKS